MARRPRWSPSPPAAATPPRLKTSLPAVRSIGVTEVTYYRWRQEYGGLKSDQVKRLKALETENARLRRAVSDLTLDKLILQEAARGNVWSAPSVQGS